MNCKPGDLAVVIREEWTPGLAGHIVTVLHIAIPGEYLGGQDLRVADSCSEEPTWVVEAASAAGIPVKRLNGRVSIVRLRPIADRLLRPIRNPGADATDEMVRIAGPAPMTLTELLEGQDHA